MPLEAELSYERHIVGVSTFEGYFGFQFIFSDGSRSNFSDSNLVRAA
jgi:hypothetical protein